MADKLAERITTVLQTHALDGRTLTCRAEGCGWSYTADNDHCEHVAGLLAAELRAQIPTVAFKGDTTDVEAFRGAAAKLDTGYAPGGGNMVYAVSRLLRQAAIALEGCTADELEARAKNGWTR